MNFFRSSKKAKHKQEIETLTGENNALRESEELTKAKLKEMEEVNGELARSVDSLKLENKQLKDKLDREEPYEKIFNERKQLMEECESQKTQIRELQKENVALSDSVEKLQEQNQALEEDKSATASVLATEKEKQEEYEQHKDDHVKQITDLEKEKNELENELFKLKKSLEDLSVENKGLDAQVQEEKEKGENYARAYIEELRGQLAENRTKIENLQLESEALKSENEALFRANDSRKKEMEKKEDEIRDIKKTLQLERDRFKKLETEWETKNKTEFVLVSKSGKGGRKSRTIEEETGDSEDEHIVGVLEAAKKEGEELRNKERDLRKKVNQLQIDKEELFRSGTNLFAENKSIKAKYNDVLRERTELLQVEAALKRKVRNQEEEIKDLKKTVDDLYYQNISIRSNEEEQRQNALVVVMGNEMIKKLEREKSALHKRVKFLEKENREIENRVIDLERKSSELIEYSQKLDKHSMLPAAPDNRNNYIQILSPQILGTNQDRNFELTRKLTGMQHTQPSELTESYRSRQYQEYRDISRPPYQSKTPDQYKQREPVFGLQSRQQSRQPSSIPSIKSHTSRFSLPQIGNRNTQSPLTNSVGGQTPRRNTPQRK